MAKPQPEQRQEPIVQRLRIRYAKRGPLRFTSHRDFARAFERAVRRAGVPIAYSQGFTPHPKISYASASPTGVASEAEYLELALREVRDPQEVRLALDAALSPGLDIIAAVEAPGGASLAELIDASRWWIELPGCDHGKVVAAVAAFEAADAVLIDRMTKQGRRQVDTRAGVLRIQVPTLDAGTGRRCAILDAVVRQVTPTVRPDDILAGLRAVAELELPEPARATRLAQGRLTSQGDIVDPLVTDDATFAGGAVVGEPSGLDG